MPAGTQGTCRVTFAGRWSLRKGELRRLSITFDQVAEVAGGDPLVGPPAVTLLETGSGVLISAEGVVSPVVSFLANLANAIPGDWPVEVTCPTAAGSRLVRVATIRVES
jgi:hypothetical protein